MIDLFHTTTFTRSDGTLFSRIYERLTKASRRRVTATVKNYEDIVPAAHLRVQQHEAAYRRGVKDTLEALREELGG